MRAILFAMMISVSSAALAVDSGGSGPTLGEARTMIEAEDYASAITALNDIIALDHNNADALNLLGYALRKAGRPEDAEVYYLRALAIEPEHLGANEYLGALYVEAGDLAKANERLAVLQAACGDACEETMELAELIEAAQ